MDNISWTDNVRYVEGLRRGKEERHILYVIKGMKANYIGHVLLRNCLLNTLLKGGEGEG